MSYFATGYRSLPSQKRSESEKDEEWVKECINSGEAITFALETGTRENRINKKINYDLYNGILDPIDVERINNPHAFSMVSSSNTVKNFPITNPKVKELIGEEFKRRFDFNIYVTDPDAISQKEKEKNEILNNTVNEILLDGLQQPQTNDPQEQQKYQQEVEKRLKETQDYVNSSWRDKRELGATRMLEHYSKENKPDTLPILFNKGWEDALLVAEEVYTIEEFNKTPSVRKVNPLNLYYLTTPDNPNIDDSDLIVEKHYKPIGQVIDEYKDYLTNDDITALEERRNTSNNKNQTGEVGYQGFKPIFRIWTNELIVDREMLETDTNTDNHFAGVYDANGNVREILVTWKSYRKIGELTYFDENGEQVKTNVDEHYKASKSKGETIKWLWIPEYWRGVKIGGNIFVKCGPKEVQFRDINNIASCSSGYVGGIYNTNSSKAQSLFDIMKPYQYLYNIFMHRTLQQLMKVTGNIAILKTSLIPDDMDAEMMMYYAANLGFIIEDDFKEGKKGAAGKYGGQFNNQRVINMEQSAAIQQNMLMMNTIKQELDEITGINRQRQGSVSQTAAVGTTQQAIQQSYNVTEWYFRKHDNIKLRVMKTLLECCKYCLKEGNLTFQYILDETTSQVFKIEGDILNESSYGISITNASEDGETLNALKRAFEAAFQTGQIDVIEYMHIFDTSSISERKRKIQTSIQKKQQQTEQARQEENQIKQEDIKQQREIAKEALAYQEEEKQKDRNLKQYEIDENNRTKISIAEMTALGFEKASPESIDNTAELALKREEINSKNFTEQQKILHEKNKHSKETELKTKELEDKKEIENKKIEAIKLQNTSQEKIAKDSNKLKEKEMNNKLIIEKIKAKSKPKTNKK